MSAEATFYTTPAQDICAELDEAISDIRRAQRPLDELREPTPGDYDTALRAISDAQQRIEWAADLIRAEIRRL